MESRTRPLRFQHQTWATKEEAKLGRPFWMHCFWKDLKSRLWPRRFQNQTWANKEANLGHPGMCIVLRRHEKSHKALAIPKPNLSNKGSKFRSSWNLHCFLNRYGKSHKAAAIPTPNLSKKGSNFRSFWGLHCFWTDLKSRTRPRRFQNETWANKEANLGHPGICIVIE